MIELQLKAPSEGDGYETVLTLTVADDGSYEIDQTRDLRLEEVPIRDRTVPGWQLWLKDDPAKWARSAHKAFRTGYLVPVIVRDDDAE